MSREIAEGLSLRETATQEVQRRRERRKGGTGKWEKRESGKAGKRESGKAGKRNFAGPNDASRRTRKYFIRRMAKKEFSEADDPLTYRIIGCAIAVHRELGPGLLESVYDECLGKALTKAGISFSRKPRIRISYEGSVLDREYRPDFLVEDAVVVEVKSVAHFLPVHHAQLLTYMKLPDSAWFADQLQRRTPGQRDQTSHNDRGA